MALVTYLVAMGVALGRQGRFSPELLGSYAWYALVLLAFEVLVNQVVAAAALGVRSQVAAGVSALEQTSCAAYKFVHLCLVWALGALTHRSAPLETPVADASSTGGPGLLYWLLLAYCAAASFYFAVRFLVPHTQYSTVQYTVHESSSKNSKCCTPTYAYQLAYLEIYVFGLCAQARSLKSGYMRSQAEAPRDAYFGAQAAFGGTHELEMGHRRRYYLLLMFAALQVLFLWLLARGAFD